MFFKVKKFENYIFIFVYETRQQIFFKAIF